MQMLWRLFFTFGMCILPSNCSSLLPLYSSTSCLSETRAPWMCRKQCGTWIALPVVWISVIEKLYSIYFSADWQLTLCPRFLISSFITSDSPNILQSFIADKSDINLRYRPDAWRTWVSSWREQRRVVWSGRSELATASRKSTHRSGRCGSPFLAELHLSRNFSLNSDTRQTFNCSRQ